MNVLVTGGCGFIGSNLIRYALAAHPDASIVNLDKLTYAGNAENLKDIEGGSGKAEVGRKDPSLPPYQFVRGDIADRALVEPLIADGRFDAVVNFAAGGVATPADAALMMQLGVDGVFVGSGIFKSGDPARRAAAIVKAVTHYQDADILAEVSKNLGEPMVGRNVSQMPEVERIAGRGW